MKKVIGTTIRREGSYGERRFQVIECQDCGAITYQRRQSRVEAALSRDCQSCKEIQAKAREGALQLRREQDKALIDAHRAILKLQKRLQPNKCLIHGLSTGDNRRTYKIWQGMMARCYKANTAGYHHYGGRGIAVCERWHDVANFFEDMGRAPDGYSIERHDVNGNYEPSNCSWIPKKHQSKNRRNCLANRGITDAAAHSRDYQRKRGRRLKGLPEDTPFNFRGAYYTGKAPANAWWRAANRPDIRGRVYGPLQYGCLYQLRTR